MLLIQTGAPARCLLPAVALLLVSLAGPAAQDQGSPPPGREGRPAGPAAPLDRTAKATGGRAGTGSLEFLLGFYNNGDGRGDGNPFLDEELTVIEPVVYFDYNFDDLTSGWAKFSFDLVSSASIDRLSNYPNQSGASGDTYFGLEAGFHHRLGPLTRFGSWLHASLEYDYRSFGVGGYYAWDQADRNGTTKLSANLFFDTLDLILYNGVDDGTDDRLSLTANLTRYQVLTELMHAEYGLTLTRQDGFLGTPYNAVVLEDPSHPVNPNLHNNARGVEIAERLPDTRTRIALHGRLRRHILEDSALELGGRLYWDTWGITGFSLEPRFFTWLDKGSLSSQLRYRLYIQTEGDDFRDHYYEADRYRRHLTQDADLGGFTLHGPGAELKWRCAPDTTIGLGVDYMFRSDGLDYLMATLSIGWRF